MLHDLTGSVIPEKEPNASKEPSLSLVALQDEIKKLAKEFQGNDRQARNYLENKNQITDFLNLIRGIATDELSKKGVLSEEKIIFSRSVDELSLRSGLSYHDVKKYLRWFTNGLDILQCRIPKKEKNPF